MHWIAPTEKNAASTTLEKRLWDAADQFRANSGLKAQEYSGPILGLIFLRFAEVRFAVQRRKLDEAGASSRRGSRVDEPAAYHAAGVLYLAPEARFDALICDMVLPGESGLQVLKDVRGSHPDMKVIAVSGGKSDGKSLPFDVLNANVGLPL